MSACLYVHLPVLCFEAGCLASLPSQIEKEEEEEKEGFIHNSPCKKEAKENLTSWMSQTAHCEPPMFDLLESRCTKANIKEVDAATTDCEVCASNHSCSEGLCAICGSESKFMAASVVGGGNTHRMCVGRSSMGLALGLMGVAVVASVIFVAVRKSRA